MGDTGGHGQRLVHYLEQLAGDQSMRSFAQSKDIDVPSITRWRSSDPSIEGLRQVAIGLGKPLGEILIIAGYGTPEDFGGMDAPPPTPPSVRDAIEHDPSLTPAQRDAFRVLFTALTEVTSSDGHIGRGNKRSITLTT